MSKANTVEKYMKALCGQDLDGIVALYAQDATVEDPIGTPIHTGKAAIREFYSKATSVKLSASLSGELRIAGDFVAFPFTIIIPSEKGETRMEIIDTFKFNEQGLVTEMKAYWSEKNCHLV